MLDILNLDALEALARERLEPMSFDYMAGGAADEWTLAENRAAFHRIQLLPRMLRGVADRSLATTVLGTPVSMPVLVPPMGFQGLCHAEAEAATARGTAAEDTIYCASTVSNCSLEAIAAASDGPKWFQLYVYRDKAITRDLVARATAAGFRALCLTVDTPLAGHRERDRRNSYRMPPHLALGNFPEAHTSYHHRGEGQGSALAQYINAQWDPGLTWDDVAWLRSVSPLPVIVKGVLAPADAVLAIEHGASAVIVSNHGGRQLDTVPAPIAVLRGVVDAVSGRAEVLVDGGVRRGTDVLKALALGARAVLVGRPILWGLTLDGADGVRAVLRHLREELDLAMALAGCATVGDATTVLIYSMGERN
ncbi:MAG TPA: alpha-hydroxy acid oxidase [Gemmatimonadaceae bacterium]|nr:alpha-hydroxy acid oxidase [Gemmatimonadaceae bacterium]